MPKYHYEIIDSRAELGLAMADFFTSTQIGISLLCAGLFWLMNFFVPIMLEGGIGLMAFIAVPILLVIAIVLFFLTVIYGSLNQSHHTVLIYSTYASYAITPYLKSQGWLGHSQLGIYFAYCVVWFSALFLFTWLTNRNQKTMIATGLISAIYVGYMICGYYLNFGLNVLLSVGWLHGING